LAAFTKTKRKESFALFAAEKTRASYSLSGELLASPERGKKKRRRFYVEGLGKPDKKFRLGVAEKEKNPSLAQGGDRQREAWAPRKKEGTCHGNGKRGLGSFFKGSRGTEAHVDQLEKRHCCFVREKKVIGLFGKRDGRKRVLVDGKKKGIMR